MTITLNHDLADQVLGQVMHLYYADHDPYSRESAVLPEQEKWLPANLFAGGQEDPNYWFALCYYMRGRVKSVLVAQRLAIFYERFPELFDFRVAATWEADALAEVLYRNGLPFMSPTVAAFWVSNAQRFVQLGHANILEAYDGISSYDQACDLIAYRGRTGFRGFQEKMVSMLTYYLDVRGLIEAFPYPMPIDLHALRLINQHELITFSRKPSGGNYGNQKGLAACRELVLSFTERHGVPDKDLAAAVWLYSEQMCAKDPASRMKVTRYKEGPRKGEIESIEYSDLDWSKPGTLAAYNASCGHCTIRSTCQWHIPSAPYVNLRKLVKERRRDDPRYSPPAEPLFNIAPSNQYTPKQNRRVVLPDYFSDIEDEQLGGDTYQAVLALDLESDLD